MNEPFTEALTVALARQAFITAFWLSQGDGRLQHLLFQAVAARRPGWVLTETIWQALGQLADTVSGLAARGQHNPFESREVVRLEVDKQRDRWRSALVRRGPATSVDYERILYRLIAGFVERDAWYARLGARWRSEGEESHSPHTDRYLSFVCHYLLLGHQTGCQVFDEILADMARCVQRGGFFRARRSFPDATRANLALVIAFHNCHHSGAQVSIAQSRRKATIDAPPNSQAGRGAVPM